MKKTFTPKEKSLIALKAIRGDKTLAEIGSCYEVDPKQVSKWKRLLEENAPEVFSSKRKKDELDKEKLIDHLYKMVGQRDIELDWLKKKLHIFDKS